MLRSLFLLSICLVVTKKTFFAPESQITATEEGSSTNYIQLTPPSARNQVERTQAVKRIVPNTNSVQRTPFDHISSKKSITLTTIEKPEKAATLKTVRTLQRTEKASFPVTTKAPKSPIQRSAGSRRLI